VLELKRERPGTLDGPGAPGAQRRKAQKVPPQETQAGEADRGVRRLQRAPCGQVLLGCYLGGGGKVRYCGEACQQQLWRSATHPHKASRHMTLSSLPDTIT